MDDDAAPGHHCLHSTGHGSMKADGGSGVMRMQCCWCGEQWQISWQLGVQPLPGHGSYVKKKVKIFDGVPTEKCPDAPGPEVHD